MARDIPATRIFAGQKIMNPDGTPTDFFVNAFNELIDRTGGERFNEYFGVINGSIKQAQLTAESAKEDAADAAIAGGATMTAAASPTSAQSSSGGATNTVTVTPTGGTGPYTYAWTKVSGDTMNLSDDDGQATTFSSGVVPAEAVYKCTVTDSLSAVAATTIYVLILNVVISP